MEGKTWFTKANDSFPIDDDALDEPQLLALLEEAESKIKLKSLLSRSGIGVAVGVASKNAVLCF